MAYIGGISEVGGCAVARSECASADGYHRHALARTWDLRLSTLAVVGLNPSHASGVVDDASTRRLITFAAAWGFGAVELVNLYSFRSSSPAAMTHARRSGVDVTGGAGNDRTIVEATRGRTTLLMWGASVVAGLWVRERAREVLRLIAPTAGALVCLGRTSDGSPRHVMARGRHRVPDTALPQSFTALDVAKLGEPHE